MVSLDDIRNAMDKNLGRDMDLARSLADKYVEENPTQFEQLRGLSLDQCVQAIDLFRSGGLDDDQWRVEVWLLHAYPEPHSVFGAINQPLDIEQLLKGASNG